MQNTFNRLLKFRSKLPNIFLRIFNLDKMNSNHFFKFMFLNIIDVLFKEGKASRILLKYCNND